MLAMAKGITINPEISPQLHFRAKKSAVSISIFRGINEANKRALKIATNFGYLKESPKALVHGALISAFLTVGNSISDQGCV